MHLFFDCDSILVEETEGKTHPGVATCLKKLARDHSLYIVSQTEPENIYSTLKKADLDDFFADVFGKDRIGEVGFYHHVFLNPIHELNIEKEKALVLGDTKEDIRAARKAGIPIIACSWGTGSREELIEERPEFIADTPQELLSIIEEM